MIAALLALAAAAPPACGAPPLADGPRPWATGERTTYDLDLLGAVRAGTLELSVEPPVASGQVIPLRARARTDASVAAFKRVVAVSYSWVDARTLLPERFREEASEDGTHKLSDARMARGEPELVLQHESGRQRSTRRVARQGAALDAVSGLFLLRAAKLTPGERYCFDLVARGRVWRIQGGVAARTEKVDTPVGRLETVRVDGTAVAADGPDEKPAEIHLWISTDPRRLLVAVVAVIDAGPVRAMLTGVDRPQR
ncbi:MAG: DUF3108 domain-containing protein [Anaeromyxobacter sp.]